MKSKLLPGGIAMAVLILPLVGCPSSAPQVQSHIGSNGDAAPTAGSMGGACTADSDCPGGELCLSPSIGIGTDKYCAPSCSQTADCVGFAETSFTFTVPDTVTPQGGSPTATAFGMTTLNRGYACGPVAGHAGNYCQFACSDTEAFSKDGHCYCLPGYEPNADKTACVFGRDIQCSVLSFLSPDDQKKVKDTYGIQIANPTCDACNSSMTFTDGLGCHTGLFACEIYNVDLKGRCAEILTSDAFNACIASATNFTCNCENSCSDACDLNDVSCIDNCCTCTAAPTSPAPKCTGSPGVDGGSDGDADAD
jgi:hypothetical protein